MHASYLIIILIQIAIAGWVIYYFTHHDRGPKEPVGALRLAGVLGAVAVVIGVVVEGWVLSPGFASGNHSNLPLGVIAVDCLLVGLIEESAKALPLTAFIYRRGYFNELTDGIIYYGISGTVFGLLEDIGYTLIFGPGIGIARIVSGPFMHAGLSSLFGFTVARRKVLKARWWTPVAGFLGAVGLHALYDGGLFFGQAAAVLLAVFVAFAVNVGIFILYDQATRADVRRGMSSVGENRYCRHCGQPNPQHNL
ncbi:MAG TPA: PrsW family glutamic-type intramembrane protease, partial [Candidatus Saccharimonadales bacterium]|nr:PrsW family glutamic-type intramembrane protease [Candidatus Saccharimonadales bacterium]